MLNQTSFNLELFYILITVADYKSINKSSTFLMQTQPAISKKIKQLEHYFGTQLFTRSSKGMELTTTGKQVYSVAQKILQDFEELHQSIAINDVKLSALRIGTLDSISSSMYPDFFIEAMPVVQNLIISNKIFELVDPFNNDNLDAIFIDSSFKQNFRGEFHELKLFVEPYFLVYSNSNKNIKNFKTTSLTALDLRQLSLLMYPKYCPIHQRIKQIYSELNLIPPPIIEIDYSESTIALIDKSNYVTILPQSVAENKIANNSNLAMKSLDISFMRSVSLFTRDANTAAYINSLLN